MEWQTIDTAPKGVDLLLYYPSTPSGRIRLPQMYKVAKIGDTPMRQPTNWMPLPEPPKDK
jgi:hypothetical protein